MSVVTQVLIKDGQLHRAEYGADQTIVALVKAWIELSVRDGEDTSSNATMRISELQSHLLKIKAAAIQIQERPDNDEAHLLLAENVTASMAKISDCVVALQFYDRVAQRLMHAKHFLDVGHVDDHAPLIKVLAMDDERVLFDAIIDGMPELEAIKLAQESLNKTVQEDDNDIDLF